MRENTDKRNSEYRHFLRSDSIWYDMINLFNFGIKTVVDIIIKYY